MPEFRDPDFSPRVIRQARTYTRAGRNAQAITRFLMERGTVEVLSNEDVKALFTEIHHAAHRLRRLAKTRLSSTKEAGEALSTARTLVSTMEAAEEELFIANRRLVVNCIKPFFWIGQVWIADFLQEGSKALTNAVRKFDYTRGTPFYAYAQIAVQNRLRNYFRDHVRAGSIGIRPTRDMELIKKASDDWSRRHDGEAPDRSTLAKLTGLDEVRIKKVQPFIRQWEKYPAPPVSLDAMVGEGDASMYNFVEEHKSEGAFESLEKSELWEYVDQLPPRSRYIMRLRFIEGRTLEETGEKLDLTRARIKQIQDASLAKIRHMMGHGDTSE